MSIADERAAAIIAVLTDAMALAQTGQILTDALSTTKLVVEMIARADDVDGNLKPELSAALDASGVLGEALAQAAKVALTRYEVANERLTAVFNDNIGGA